MMKFEMKNFRVEWRTIMFNDTGRENILV